jgi:hypothetical protein
MGLGFDRLLEFRGPEVGCGMNYGRVATRVLCRTMRVGDGVGGRVSNVMLIISLVWSFSRRLIKFHQLR